MSVESGFNPEKHVSPEGNVEAKAAKATEVAEQAAAGGLSAEYLTRTIEIAKAAKKDKEEAAEKMTEIKASLDTLGNWQEGKQAESKPAEDWQKEQQKMTEELLQGGVEAEFFNPMDKNESGPGAAELRNDFALARLKGERNEVAASRENAVALQQIQGEASQENAARIQQLEEKIAAAEARLAELKVEDPVTEVAKRSMRGPLEKGLGFFKKLVASKESKKHDSALNEALEEYSKLSQELADIPTGVSEHRKRNPNVPENTENARTRGIR